jgi:PAS domain S-box-containing protein
MTPSSSATERLLASEQALRASQHLIQRITDAAPATIYIYDLVQQQNVYANRNIITTLGYSQEEIVALGNTLFAQLMHPTDLALLPERLARFPAAQDSDLIITEYRMRHADGSWRWLYSREVIFARNEAGQPTQVLGVVQDITDQKVAEEEVRRLNAELEARVQERTGQLEAAIRELEAFSYSVSHDLRAPLRAIDGFSRIVWEEYATQLDGDGREYLRLVRENTRQMGQLIDDLLAFSRLNRQAIQPQPLDMDSVVQRALASFTSEIERRAVSVTLAPLAPCAGDAAMLRLVWVNLIANALKYTRHQPQASISIGSRQEGSELIYFIRDNGVGFDMRYAHKLFGVFQRLHRAEEYEGNGVGLATVQRVIHRHGGRVWGESAPGQGAYFAFALPAESPLSEPIMLYDM